MLETRELVWDNLDRVDRILTKYVEEIGEICIVGLGCRFCNAIPDLARKFTETLVQYVPLYKQSDLV